VVVYLVPELFPGTNNYDKYERARFNSRWSKIQCGIYLALFLYSPLKRWNFR
jgi:hypothetical protein